MKKLTWLLLLISTLSKAQNLTLQGSVQYPDGKPAFGATVLLYAASDTLLLKAAACNPAGRFSFSGLAAGAYTLAVSSMGYQPLRQNTVVLTPDFRLPVITLKEQSRELAAVQVKAQKQLVETLPDKTVFNVQLSLAATGLSAFELLRKAPGVIIDNQNSLIVEGKTGVQLYINGKPALLGGDDLTTYLKTLQSSDLEAIEIITQPSSRYEAAGSAGIINLRLKRNKNLGTSGSLAAGYAIGRYGKYNASLSLNHRSARLSLFSTYNNNIGKNYNYLNLDRLQSGVEYNQRSFNISHDYAHNVRAGADYNIDSANTVGLLLTGNFGGYHATNTSRTPISPISTGLMQQVLDAYNYSSNHNTNLAVNLNYRYAGKLGQELLIDGDYGYYSSGRSSFQPNTYYDARETAVLSQTAYRQLTPEAIHLSSFKADYSLPLGKIKLGTGLKTSLVKTDNVFDFYDVSSNGDRYNPGRSNIFYYAERINAAYINISENGKKLSYQAGLRAEQTRSDGDLLSSQQNTNSSVKRNYLNLFPSGGLTYLADARNTFAFIYSRRIERPDYRSLNPFEYNTDELSFSKGNPFLKPQYTDALKLSHTYNYTLTTAISYSYIHDFFAQITDTLSGGRNFISPQNIANEQVINLGISYPFNVNKWWSVYVSLNAYRSIYRASSPKFIPVNQNTFSFYGQNTFNLPADCRLEVSGWFSSPSIWAGTYRTRSLGSLDLAMQKTWNRLSVRLALADVFKTSNWTGNTQYGALYIKGSGGYESRQLRLSLNYTFGRKSIKASGEHKSGAEDEKQRIGG